MDEIPPPFDRFVEINADQQFLKCWYGSPVRLKPDGQLEPHHDPVSGLLVLTDKGLVHCLKLTTPTSGLMRVFSKLGPLTIGVRVDVKVPFARLQEVELVKSPSVLHRMLRLRVQGDAAVYSPQYEPGQVAGTDLIHFLLAERVNAQEVLRFVKGALARASPAGVAPLERYPTGSSSGGPPSSAETGGSSGGDWIHLHSEQE